MTGSDGTILSLPVMTGLDPAIHAVAWMAEAPRFRIFAALRPEGRP